MTANQLKYAELQENKRANLARENLESRNIGTKETANDISRYRADTEASRLDMDKDYMEHKKKIDVVNTAVNAATSVMKVVAL